MSLRRNMTIIPPSKLLLVGGAAFRPFRCLWMLEELGVPYEHSGARPWSAESKKYHPLGKIPSLVVNDGELTLYESSAINTFLGDSYGQFVPREPFGRAKYDQTVTFIVSELDSQGLWIHRKHESLAKVFGKSAEAVAEARQVFDKANQVLASQLNPYLLESGFSGADILYVHCLEWAENIGWNDKFDPKVNDYLSLCREREGFKRAVSVREASKRWKERQTKEKRTDKATTGEQSKL